MTKDDLIALGLRGHAAAAIDQPVPASPLEPLRANVERLLSLLRDFVAVVDLADEGALLVRIDEWLKVTASATNVEAVQSCIDACNEACRGVLSKIDQQRIEQKKEIAALIGMVHEALAIVSGDGQTFNRHLGNSMERFEALVRIEDVRLLKTQLVREIGALREIAAERQRSWEATVQKFKGRAEVLERQLALSKEEAALDPLTRIANRSGFDRACQDWLASEHVQFVMALIDLDDLKNINDTHGHGAGDRALVAVAQAVKNSIRAGADVVARIGGDEFAVLIADLNIRQAESRLRMLSTSLAALKFETPTNTPLKLTLSIGLAECSAGDTPRSLMERADAALYEAKRLGKNRVVTRAKPTLRELLEH